MNSDISLDSPRKILWQQNHENSFIGQGISFAAPWPWISLSIQLFLLRVYSCRFKIDLNNVSFGQYPNLIPENPENQGNYPDNPENPENPEYPENQENPENPEDLENPGFPGIPGFLDWYSRFSRYSRFSGYSEFFELVI